MSEIPDVAGRYQIETELARGGMGFVCSAVDRSTGKRVALKRMLESTSSNGRFLRLFQREYHTLVQLQHPRIIEVFDYGVDARGAYYTMELLDGKDLRELAPLGYREACRHLRDVASSLALLHARRLVHRDLSARNVRLTSDGRAKLLDFGALATFGKPGDIVGTPPAVPPEALNGSALDQRADLYAFGALSYWLLTGRHAYAAHDIRALPSIWQQGAPPPPSRFAPDVPRELDVLVLSLLSLDPSQRPSTAAEVIERLNVIAGLESEEVLDVGHSYLSNPRVVGRDEELRRLRELLERVVGGRSASLLIEGEAGVGKTRLVEEIAIEAQLKGVTAIRVDAEMARGPYGVIRGLAEGLVTAMPDRAIELGRPHAAVLSELVPALREKLDGVDKESLPKDPGERRMRIQEALSAWLLSIAGEGPLLLIVGNAHAADEASLALLAVLPRLAPTRTLGILATRRLGDELSGGAAFASLREASKVITLKDLTPADTEAFVQALFGDVDHIGRLGRWLHDRAGGNPARCIALATQLIMDGHVTYRNGAWAIPSELSRDLLPAGMDQVLERRVSQLGAGAKALADAVSIERGAFSLEECVALTGLEGDELFERLDELVQKNVLVGAGTHYRFTQAALRTFLEDRLSEGPKRDLHRRAGEYKIAIADADAVVRLEAGRHLLSAGQHVRGAEIIAAVGADVASSAEGLALAAPALETALEIFDREKRSKWRILTVLELLTLAGWYTDRRYAVKYGERTLGLALELTGLSGVEKLSRVLGAKLAMTVGMLFRALVHRLIRSSIDIEKYREFRALFAPLVVGLSVTIGVAANSFDAEMARRLIRRARILTAFPKNHVFNALYDYARYYALATEGRYGEAAEIGVRTLAWIRSPEALKFMDEPHARALAGGQMTGLGAYTAMGGSAEALEWADQLDGLGLSFYALMATRTRFIHRVMRGEMGKAAPFREQLELNAIRGGSTWQTSLLVPLMHGAAHSAGGEVARMRQDMEEMERLSTDIPPLVPVARFLRAAADYFRGRPAEALPILEELNEGDLAPRRHTLWAFSHGIHVRVLLALGKSREALALGRRALEHMTPEDRRFGIAMIELPMAVALAEVDCGDAESAAKRIDTLIDEQAPREVPLVLGRLHETRARIAAAVGDAARFDAELEQMKEWARSSENAALIAKCKRVETEGRMHIDSQRTGADGSPVSAVFEYATAVRTLLDQHTGLERGRAALRLLLEQTNARSGYLYLGASPKLKLVAQIPEDLPPSEVLSQRIALLAASVQQSAEDLDATDRTGTAALSETALPTQAMTSSGDLSPHLLVVSEDGRPRVVGAVALRFGHDGSERPSFEMLEVIARNLVDLSLTFISSNRSQLTSGGSLA